MKTKFRCIHVPEEQTIFHSKPAPTTDLIHYGNFRFIDGIYYAALCVKCSDTSATTHGETLIRVQSTQSPTEEPNP